MSAEVLLPIKMVCEEGETDTVVDWAMPNPAHDTAANNATAGMARQARQPTGLKNLRFRLIHLDFCISTPEAWSCRHKCLARCLASSGLG